MEPCPGSSASHEGEGKGEGKEAVTAAEGELQTEIDPLALVSTSTTRPARPGRQVIVLVKRVGE